MDKKIRAACFVGAISGIAPLLVNLIGVDAELIIDSFQLKIFIGYMIKAMGLMALGAFVVFINSEVDLKKAFQLGLMAPAFVVGAINANNYSNAKNEVVQLEKALVGDQSASNEVKGENTFIHILDTLSFTLIGNAYADEHIVKKGINNTPTTSRLIWYGITGNIKNSWFVFVGSHQYEADAEKQVKELALKGYDAVVQPPFGSNEYFGVAIGSYVSLEQARSLKQEALKDGLPKDTYLWKWK